MSYELDKIVEGLDNIEQEIDLVLARSESLKVDKRAKTELELRKKKKKNKKKAYKGK
jgi:hypothetical protein